MEKTIDKGEILQRIMQDNTRNMVYRFYLSTRTYEYVTPASLDIFGYSPLEIQSLPELIDKSIHPEYHQLYNRQRELLVLGKRVEPYEYQIINKNGVVKWVEERSLQVFDEQGRVIALEGMLTDITETKRKTEKLSGCYEHVQARLNEQTVELLAASKQLQEIFNKLEDKEKNEETCELWYRTMVEEQEEIVCRWLPDTTLTFVNESYCRFTGKRREELLGIKWLTLVPEDVRPEVAKTYQETVRQAKKLIYEHKSIGHHNNTLWHTWQDCPLLDETGQVIAYQSIGRDITKQKEVEEALRKERDFAKNLIETAQTIILVIDLEGRIIDINPFAEKLSGYKKEEVIGKDAYKILLRESDREKTREFLNSSMGDDKLTTMISTVIIKDGTELQIEWNNNTLKDSDGNFIGILIIGQDITEQQQMQQELKREKDTLQSLATGLSEMKIGVDIVGTDYSIKYQNQVLQELFGDYLGEICYQKYEGLSEPCNPCPMQKAIKTNKPETVELKGKNGKQYQVIASPLRNPDGSIDKAIEVIIDITEHKQMEEALRASEQRYWSVIDNIGIGIAVLNTKMELMALNKQMRRWYPDIDTSLHQVCYRIFNNPPREGVCSYCPTAKTLQDGQTHEAITETPTPDGIINYRIVSTPLLDSDNKIVGVIEMVEDITERQKMEEALSASEEKYRTIFENAGEGIVITVVSDTSFMYANSTICMMLGYTQDELLGMKVADIHPQEFIPELMADLRSHPEDENLQINNLPFLCRDGTVFYADLKTSSVMLEGQRCHICFITDITARKQMEEQLRQSEKMKVIGQLAGGIAHDFNNQLTGIIGYSDMIISKSQDADIRAKAKMINTAALRSADLTEQLLAFARKGKYFSTIINLHQIIAEVIAFLSRTIDKRVNIKEFLEAEPSLVIGDASQLQSAILNIALNARDAIPEKGEIIFRTRITQVDEGFCQDNIYPINPGYYLELNIIDTGMGMDEETRKHIFEPFFTTKDINQGTGMGLSAVDGTIRSHQGAISFTSEPGEGTAFSIYLPLADKAGESELEPTGQIEREDYTDKLSGIDNAKTLQILLVDDEAVVCEMIKDALEELGCEVTTVKDGMTALEYYRKQWRETDLIILDLMMPKVSGHEIFSKMRIINPEARVIISSGYSLNDEVKTMLRQGAHAFIQKPYKGSELQKVIQEAAGVC
ncbi:MAG: PAS domain S-box protein [Planctomycetes bacterium]|nr:PAS domain S-box protein [Planctomycetota bacterium]